MKGDAPEAKLQEIVRQACARSAVLAAGHRHTHGCDVAAEIDNEVGCNLITAQKLRQTSSEVAAKSFVSR